jgi:hypothetical protein
MKIIDEAPKQGGKTNQEQNFVEQQSFVRRLAFFVAHATLWLGIILMKLIVAFPLFFFMGKAIGFDRLFLVPQPLTTVLTPNIYGYFTFLIVWEIISLVANKYQYSIGYLYGQGTYGTLHGGGHGEICAP